MLYAFYGLSGYCTKIKIPALYAIHSRNNKCFPSVRMRICQCNASYKLVGWVVYSDHRVCTRPYRQLLDCTSYHSVVQCTELERRCYYGLSKLLLGSQRHCTAFMPF